MKTLKDLRDTYLKKNTQFIITNKVGKVIESDNVLFRCKQGVQLSEIHPFFISLETNVSDHASEFTCVHLDIANTSFICDISIKKQEDNILVIITDFSKHYNSFQSLAQSRNETAISSEFIEVENFLLNKKGEFKNQFLENFNHELVTPVLSLLTFSNMLKKTPLSVEQKEYLEIIESSSGILKAMINDIFDITKVETGNLDITNKRFSIKRLIKVIKEDYSKKFKSKNLKLKVIYDEYMPNYIVSDKLRIHQIITNLLDNALKYTPSGTVTLSIEAIYRRARKLTYTIKVIDTGIGIAPEHHDYIFERFSRLVTSNNIPGNGLGLSITKELVRLMQGDIHLESSLGTGSVFVVTLRTTTPLKDPKKKNNKKVSDDLSVKKEILLVEDSYSDQLSIFKILASTKKFYIDIVTDGKEAIKLKKQKDYDLILMDYKLDSIDGLEASKTINISKKGKTPIILISGLKIKKAILDHYKPYINTVLHKPFDPKTLLELIDLHSK